jgi:hypothetical protein
MSIEQYIDDTTYLQWEDGMYVMLDDMECDYELALVEDSLRDSRHFVSIGEPMRMDDCLGIWKGDADYWAAGGNYLHIKLNRAQALYIATGETTCTTS